MSTLSLLIDKKPIIFLSAELTYDIEQLAHTFHCTIEPLAINKPLPVEFKLDGKRIFSGVIDNASTSTQTSAYSMEISGRSKSANMIDSRITMDAQYGQTLEALLRSVSKNFGLTVNSLVNTKPVEEFQINAESPVDNLAQLVKEQGFILVERDGVLTIENPAHSPVNAAALEVGSNIGSLNLERNFTNQFYHIEVQGQWDDAHAAVTYAPANTMRKTVFVCDQLQSAEACQSRAQYERSLAIAKGLNASVSIDDVIEAFTCSAINRTIRVIDQYQDFNEMLLIKSVSISVDDSSTKTSLTLFRPFAEKSNV
ncbi:MULTISPECIES: phage tail protein [Vibrio]|uniref:phage tail protein n=1 Tax=Vibrio TaxID=662 RepID=UPI000B5C566F|nr:MULTISPECIES: phage tail protein [Vibrio]HBV77640.1 phage tail protein [Vibrio sp.]